MSDGPVLSAIKGQHSKSGEIVFNNIRRTAK